MGHCYRFIRDATYNVKKIKQAIADKEEKADEKKKAAEIFDDVARQEKAAEVIDMKVYKLAVVNSIECKKQEVLIRASILKLQGTLTLLEKSKQENEKEYAKLSAVLSDGEVKDGAAVLEFKKE